MLICCLSGARPKPTTRPSFVYTQSIAALPLPRKACIWLISWNSITDSRTTRRTLNKFGPKASAGSYNPISPSNGSSRARICTILDFPSHSYFLLFGDTYDILTVPYLFVSTILCPTCRTFPLTNIFLEHAPSGKKKDIDTKTKNNAFIFSLVSIDNPSGTTLE